MGLCGREGPACASSQPASLLVLWSSSHLIMVAAGSRAGFHLDVRFLLAVAERHQHSLNQSRPRLASVACEELSLSSASICSPYWGCVWNFT